VTVVATALSLAAGGGVGFGFWLAVSKPPTKRRKSGLMGEPFRRVLEEAGWSHLQPVGVLVLGISSAAVISTIVVVLVPIPVLGFIAALTCGLGAYGSLLRIRARRFQRLQVAWPGVIDHIRAGIRSGSDVVRSLAALPDTLPPDITEGLLGFRGDIQAGMNADQALGELGRRFADPVGDRIVEVLRMAHQVGGTDLPEVLSSLQRSVREDIAVREDAHARQSWIRSAAVMAVAAPWVVLIVISSRGETLQAYQGLEGTMILVVGAVVSVVAFRMMQKIGSLPPQRRWLV
jgi:tight adherence protein B